MYIHTYVYISLSYYIYIYIHNKCIYIYIYIYMYILNNVCSAAHAAISFVSSEILKWRLLK